MFSWNEASAWDKLGAIGRSPIAKSTIFLPIISYAIIYSDLGSPFWDDRASRPSLQVITPDNWFRTECIDAQSCIYALLETDVRLAILYFALNLFLFASIVFLLCPGVVKLYSTDADYFQQRGPIFSTDRFEGFVEELRPQSQRNKTNVAVPDGELMILSSQLTQYDSCDSQEHDRKERFLAAFMTSKYAFSRYEKPKTRGLILAMYGTSFVLTTATSLDGTVRVISKLIIS